MLKNQQKTYTWKHQANSLISNIPKEQFLNNSRNGQMEGQTMLDTIFLPALGDDSKYSRFSPTKGHQHLQKTCPLSLASIPFTILSLFVDSKNSHKQNSVFRLFQTPFPNSEFLLEQLFTEHKSFSFLYIIKQTKKTNNWPHIANTD